MRKQQLCSLMAFVVLHSASSAQLAEFIDLAPTSKWLAALGQAYDRDLDGRPIFSPSPLVAWSDDWHASLPTSLGFKQSNDTIAALLQQLPGVPRRLPFMAFTAWPGQAPAGDGDQELRALDQQDEMHGADPLAPPQRPFPATTPSVIAEPSVGIGFLIVGVAGWILLTVSFMILVNRQKSVAKS